MKLKPLTQQQAEQARKWRNQTPEAWRTPYMLTKEQQAAWHGSVSRRGGPRYWSIHEEGYVAMGGLIGIEWENGLAEVSLVCRPSERVFGRAATLLLRKGFSDLRLATIWGECYDCAPERQRRWLRVVEKHNGYVTHLPRRKYWDGEHHGAVYFSFDRRDFFCV